MFSPLPSVKRTKRVWEICVEDTQHVIAIFPPCSFESIVQRIETAFPQLKWPFVVLDAGIPVHLSDCLPSGTYTAVSKLKQAPRHAPAQDRMIDFDRPPQESEAPLSIPPLESLLKEWPPFLKAAVVLWRINKTIHVNYYDSDPSEVARGYFFVVAMSSGDVPRVIGLRVLSKQALASVVTERDLVYHLNKVAIEQKKVDIAEDREMKFLSALPESMLHTMAIDAFMSRKNIGGSIFRVLADGKEQRVAFATERKQAESEKENKERALRSCVVKEAERRIDVNECSLKVLVFEKDPSIEVIVPGSKDCRGEGRGEDVSLPSYAVTFNSLLKEHKDAMARIHASSLRSDDIRRAARDQLEKTNLALTKRLFWLNQLDMEQQARDAVWVARNKEAERTFEAEIAAKKAKKAAKKKGAKK